MCARPPTCYLTCGVTWVGVGVCVCVCVCGCVGVGVGGWVGCIGTSSVGVGMGVGVCVRERMCVGGWMRVCGGVACGVRVWVDASGGSVGQLTGTTCIMVGCVGRASCSTGRLAQAGRPKRPLLD